jgi:hypothetical protein
MAFNKPITPLAIVFLTCLFLTGCVQRRLLVRSQPEGAFVSIDNQPIGPTPLAAPYTYSGTRQIRLEKDGFKTVEVEQRIRPAWYDTFPISLVTNNFWPHELRDERVLEFQLEPKSQADENLLLDRANQLRGDVNRGTVTAPLR